MLMNVSVQKSETQVTDAGAELGRLSRQVPKEDEKGSPMTPGASSAERAAGWRRLRSGRRAGARDARPRDEDGR
jgi:hypothetical protein